jgi:hypothetical protein
LLKFLRHQIQFPYQVWDWNEENRYKLNFKQTDLEKNKYENLYYNIKLRETPDNEEGITI